MAPKTKRPRRAPRKKAKHDDAQDISQDDSKETNVQVDPDTYDAEQRKIMIAKEESALKRLQSTYVEETTGGELGDEHHAEKTKPSKQDSDSDPDYVPSSSGNSSESDVEMAPADDKKKKKKKSKSKPPKKDYEIDLGLDDSSNDEEEDNNESASDDDDDNGKYFALDRDPLEAAICRAVDRLITDVRENKEHEPMRFLQRVQPLSKLFSQASSSVALSSEQGNDKKAVAPIIDGADVLALPPPPPAESTNLGKRKRWIVPTSVPMKPPTKAQQAQRQKVLDEISEKLKSNVKAIVRTIPSIFITEYLRAKPRDVKWKLNMSEEEVKRLEPVLQLVRKSIDDDEPHLSKILTYPMLIRERKRMVQLYDMLQNTEPYTEAHLRLRDTMIEFLERCRQRKETNAQLETIEKEEQRLRLLLKCEQPMMNRVLQLNAPDTVKAEIVEKIIQLERMSRTSSTYQSLKEWVEWALSQPFNNSKNPFQTIKMPASSTDINAYVKQVAAILDERLYGMAVVKEKVLQFVVARITNPSANGMILALQGVPGTGKTTIAKAIADALQLPFEMISFAGMTDVSAIKGHDRGWVGTSPGQIVHALKKMQSSDGVILLDEIDKVGAVAATSSHSQEVEFALLSLTDPSQNTRFQDQYLKEFDHDVSKLIFICTMNDDSLLHPVLRNRLDIVRIHDYSPAEKSLIIQRYILPRVTKDQGWQAGSLLIDNDASQLIITMVNEGGSKHGLRDVEYALRRIVERIRTLYYITLPDGTTGDVKLSYRLSKPVTLPFTITTDIVTQLQLRDVDPNSNANWKKMFV